MSKHTSILVVEDEAFTRQLISVALQATGYRVLDAADGESALLAMERERPDLALLDVRLPGIDGWELCRRLRESREMPIIFLTALGDDEDIVKGLRAGGDDYLVKPFSPAVLVAHVEAVLRRTAGPAPQKIELGDLTVDLASGAVERDGRTLHLTATELRILSTLARRPGVMISAQQLIAEIQGLHLTDREARPLVKVHVRNLRQKIEEFPEQPRHVITVRGMGYMFNRRRADQAS
ncbi:MAG: response regulator [Chloroflexota bacterium]